MPAHRPQRGLAPEAALKRWSDSKLYAEMDALSDAWQSVSVAAGQQPTPKVLRHQAYKRLRNPLEKAFLEKLRDGVILASGRLKGNTVRVAVDPDLWDGLEVDYYFIQLIGCGLIYTSPEFFEPDAIPLNIRHAPDWLLSNVSQDPELPILVPDENYRHVSIGDVQFTFGTIQASVIRRLHQARLKGEGWCFGKDVMDEAASQQLTLTQLFKKQKNFRQLIEADGRGGYRLKAR